MRAKKKSDNVRRVANGWEATVCGQNAAGEKVCAKKVGPTPCDAVAAAESAVAKARPARRKKRRR